MRGTTSRNLSRTGRLAACGLALVLLPLAPGWANDGDKAKTPPADKPIVEPLKVEVAELNDIIVNLTDEAAAVAKTARIGLSDSFPGNALKVSALESSSAFVISDDDDDDDDKPKDKGKDKEKAKTVKGRKIDAPKLSPEEKAKVEAEIAKARAGLDKARGELKEAAQKLAEAEKKLGREVRMHIIEMKKDGKDAQVFEFKPEIGKVEIKAGAGAAAGVGVGKGDGKVQARIIMRKVDKDGKEEIVELPANVGGLGGKVELKNLIIGHGEGKDQDVKVFVHPEGMAKGEKKEINVTVHPEGIVAPIPPMPPMPPGASKPHVIHFNAVGGPAANAAQERRIKELEAKLERVLDELEKIKKSKKD